MIGIGVTTHNRYETFKKTYNSIMNYLPSGAKLVVVDDASEVPVPEASYRFDENVGIARAKNKCLELLEDCEHIFLFDDDTHPTHLGWWKPYVYSKEPHLMYVFEKFSSDLNGTNLTDCECIYKDENIRAFSQSRGCMLYLDRQCLDIVGGFDTRFGKAMNEHGNLTDRIFNAGLTSFRIMDVAGSKDLIYSADEHRAISSSIKASDRLKGLTANKKLFESNRNVSYYWPYKGLESENNVILTSYLNTFVDTQRGTRLAADYKNVETLLNSVNGRENVVLINDCFDAKDYGTVKHHKVISRLNPYFQRWLSQYEYLRDNPEIDNVFLVDATDVEMLTSPFAHMEKGKIYSGDERNITGIPWMFNNSPHAFVSIFLRKNARKTLLNCGLVGGSRKDVMNICREIVNIYLEKGKKDSVEMPLYNYVMRSNYESKIVHGFPVNTPFKKNERTEGAWFKHK